MKHISKIVMTCLAVCVLGLLVQNRMLTCKMQEMRCVKESYAALSAEKKYFCPSIREPCCDGLINGYLNASDPFAIDHSLALIDSSVLSAEMKIAILQKLLDGEYEKFAPITMSLFGFLFDSLLDEAQNKRLSPDAAPLIFRFMREKCAIISQNETPIKILEILIGHNPGYTQKFISECTEEDFTKAAELLNIWEAHYLKNVKPKSSSK